MKSCVSSYNYLLVPYLQYLLSCRDRLEVQEYQVPQVHLGDPLPPGGPQVPVPHLLPEDPRNQGDLDPQDAQGGHGDLVPPCPPFHPSAPSPQADLLGIIENLYLGSFVLLR